MNYEEMSDFEVNGYVSMTVHGFSWIEFIDGCASHVKCGNEGSPGFAMIEVPDYCNNPSDAWPIITANKMHVHPVNRVKNYSERYESWEVSVTNPYMCEECDNPLRAAMIVFLMMQGQGKCSTPPNSATTAAHRKAQAANAFLAHCKTASTLTPASSMW